MNFIMKQVYAHVPKGALIFIISALIVCNAVATYYGSDLIPNITRMITILVLLTVFFMIKNRMANIFLAIILLSLIGDAFFVFNLGEVTSQLSTFFYIGSYGLLMFLLSSQLKHFKHEGLVSCYLLILLCLSTYFLYIFYGAIKESINSESALYLSIGHGIALMGLSLFAFAAYLTRETSQSIMFLMMVFCFVFSDVLTYICDLYVYYWAFEFISNMFHVASMVILFAYVYNHKPQEEGKKRPIGHYAMSNSGSIIA